jgi:AcrR family transcriptional regulator
MNQQAKIEKSGLMENINQDYLLRGELTRRELIDAACDLFILNGFHATTTRQITEKLGLVAGALYNHFESKPALFEQYWIPTSIYVS